jgi:hypothetical protein
MIQMNTTLFSQIEASYRRRENLKSLASLAAFAVCTVIGVGAIVSLTEVTDNSNRVEVLNSALAAGDKVVKYGGWDNDFPYEIQCTRPGQANAFEIKIDRDGNRVVNKDVALVGYSQWPVNRIFGHSVPAAHCTGGVN